MIGGQVRKTLAKMTTTAAAGALTLLSTIRMAFAAGANASMSPEHAEMLRLAEQKVQAATQPGAIGNGVPMISGADAMSLLPWIGVAISAAIALVCAAKFLTPLMRNDALLAQ